MREVTSQRIATFTVGFGPAAPSFDERPYARQVAQRFETDHHEEILEPVLTDLLPAVVRHFDEPFADSSAIPTFAVAQATAKHVKVVLSGLGGDEAFAGYPRYLGLRLSERWAALPRPLRTVAAAAVRRFVPESEASRSWGNWLRRFVAGVAEPMPDRYLTWTRFFSDDDLARLARPSLQARWRGDVAAAQRAVFAIRALGDPVDGAFRIDLGTYLPDNLLVMADRMSMAHSLELRAPFCDHRLIEQSLGLPSATKLPGLALKGLLKQAFADVLPRPILRRPKQGFMVPLARWLRTDLASLMDDVLSPAQVAARGLFEPGAVAALVREHQGHARNHADRLWTLMMLELWTRQYLDGPGAWSARE
jgi:asparagine synthase (glutamine-hydrolysing)